MQYLMVLIALIFLAVKGYCGKKTSNLVRETSDAFLFNFMRMLFCALIGFVIIFAEGTMNYLKVDWKMLLICLLSGVANVAFIVGWMLAVRKNSMVSVEVGLTLGSLIPSLLCAWLFAEELSLLKMIGFAIIVLATVIVAGNNKSTAKGGLVGVILLLFAIIGDGMSGFSQQLYKQYCTEAGSMAQGVFYPKTVFHFYTYLFGMIALLLAVIVYKIITKNKNGEKTNAGSLTVIPKNIMLHIFIMAVCLFAANYFQTVATGDYGMPSQVMYPIIKGGCLITVNLTASLFFGEKMTLRTILGSVVAMVGILCMSIL